MLQLVGRNCVLCQGRISNDLDSRFCMACENPVHNTCAQNASGAAQVGCCGSCGAPPVALTARAEERRARAAAAHGQAATSMLVLGLMWIVGGVFATIMCSGLMLGAGSGRYVIATGAVAVGIGFIVRGLRMSQQR